MGETLSITPVVRDSLVNVLLPPRLDDYALAKGRKVDTQQLLVTPLRFQRVASGFKVEVVDLSRRTHRHPRVGGSSKIESLVSKFQGREFRV